MIPFSLSTIAPVLDAIHIGQNIIIHNITTDSRISSESSLFVALDGLNFNGHDFIDLALASGASALLVNRSFPLKVPQLVVPDTRRALGLLGAWVRQQVPARVLALTGSSGKTSVKNMTAAILRERGRVLSTINNFNNDIGVPLTLLRLTPEYDFAVIELGANHSGEIDWITYLVKPETALVNNLSASHLEGFSSLTGVAKAKGEIFRGLSSSGIAIINSDSHDLSNWQLILKEQIIWRFALKAKNGIDFFASNIQSDHLASKFTLHSPQGSCQVKMKQLPGSHSITNALAASALALSVGVDLDAVVSGLEKMTAIPGRLFPINLGPGRILLDDSYNANVGSMTSAVQVLANMPGYRVIVVGDMAELGEQEVDCHRQVGKIIALAKIDKVLSIGRLSYLMGEVNSLGEHFKNKIELISRLIQLIYEQPVVSILVKGSRNAAMNQIVSAVQEQLSC